MDRAAGMQEDSTTNPLTQRALLEDMNMNEEEEKSFKWTALVKKVEPLANGAHWMRPLCAAFDDGCQAQFLLDSIKSKNRRLL